MEGIKDIPRKSCYEMHPNTGPLSTSCGPIQKLETAMNATGLDRNKGDY